MRQQWGTTTLSQKVRFPVSPASQSPGRLKARANWRRINAQVATDEQGLPSAASGRDAAWTNGEELRVSAPFCTTAGQARQPSSPVGRFSRCGLVAQSKLAPALRMFGPIQPADFNRRTDGGTGSVCSGRVASRCGRGCGSLPGAGGRCKLLRDFGALGSRPTSLRSPLHKGNYCSCDIPVMVKFFSDTPIREFTNSWFC